MLIANKANKKPGKTKLITLKKQFLINYYNPAKVHLFQPFRESFNSMQKTFLKNVLNAYFCSQ
jgi:hypothetical protein